ncbi:hypothetical protein OG604_13315 [Streptomyces sp. NBC_01231]|nr:hypothetical protein OG604_13315 [Streptomyces sp. NBC_01231]
MTATEPTGPFMGSVETRKSTTVPLPPGLDEPEAATRCAPPGCRALGSYAVLSYRRDAGKL